MYDIEGEYNIALCCENPIDISCILKTSKRMHFSFEVIDGYIPKEYR